MSQQQPGECTNNGVNSIPRGWCWAKIENVIELCQYGSSAKTTEDGNGVPVLRMGNIQDGNLDLTDLKYLPSDHDEFPRHLLQEGDLLFNRTNSAELVGKSAVYGGFPFPCSYASYLVALRFGPSCLSKYVCFYLNSRYGRSWVRSVVSQQVGQANVNSTKLRSLGFPLAPLREQRRIVAKIEELFSDLDAGVVALERVRANLKRYRAAVLKAAVEGKLTEYWRAQHPDTEPAPVLLKRIVSERRKQWEKNQLAKFAQAGKKPPKGWQSKYPEPTKQGMPILQGLPKNWFEGTADQITSLITDGEHITPRRTESGVLLLSARNVLDGRVSLREVDYIPDDEFDRIRKRLSITSGDVLLSCSGTVGRSCVVPEGLVFSLVRSVAVLRPVIPIGKYISIAIRSPVVQRQITDKKTQTAQANIFLGKTRTLLLPLPPLEEIRQIVSEVERRLSIVDEIEAQVVANLKRATRLRQGTLKRAFEGRLVPQDPADEPAEKLLERIRQQRQPATKMYNGRLGTRRARRPRRTSDPLLPFPQDDGNGQGGKP